MPLRSGGSSHEDAAFAACEYCKVAAHGRGDCSAMHSQTAHYSGHMPNRHQPTPELFAAFANELADASGAAIRPWFRRPIAVDAKTDGSPVTEADRSAEAAIRERIADRFPDHGVVGEEWGSERDQAEWVWVLDPIDGTGAFISGLPTFGTLIALLLEGEPVLGVIDQPISGERWTGITFPDGPAQTRFGVHIVHSSSTTELSESTGYATTPDMFEGSERSDWTRLARSLMRVRYGIDCYAYGLLAMGCIDLVAEASLRAWDYLALPPIIRGSGGVMTDWSGEPLRLGSGSRVVATATAGLHQAALAQLNERATR